MIEAMSTPTPVSELEKAAARLTDLSVGNFYNVFSRFDWPAKLPEDQFWMPHELMTVYDTAAGSTLTREQLLQLSKWESIGFYSFNVHGERYLLMEVLQRIHTPGYEPVSEYLHHFIGEENAHSWFFSNFCYKYGKKLYPAKATSFQAETQPKDIEDFLVFARIMILEEMLDHYNVAMEKNESLHPLIRQINGTHHADESRHVAFGRKIVVDLHNKLKEKYPESTVAEVGKYLDLYINWCIESLYNPSVYRDAGIPDAYEFRNAVLADPGRVPYHQNITRRMRKFLVDAGILKG